MYTGIVNEAIRITSESDNPKVNLAVELRPKEGFHIRNNRGYKRDMRGTEDTVGPGSQQTASHLQKLNLQRTVHSLYCVA